MNKQIAKNAAKRKLLNKYRSVMGRSTASDAEIARMLMDGFNAGFIAASEPAASKLLEENQRLRAAVDRDRSGLAEGLNQALDICRAYDWLGRGEWGSYAYTEQTEATLRAEIARCLKEIEDITLVALRRSGNLAFEFLVTSSAWQIEK